MHSQGCQCSETTLKWPYWIDVLLGCVMYAVNQKLRPKLLKVKISVFPLGLSMYA